MKKIFGTGKSIVRTLTFYSVMLTLCSLLLTVAAAIQISHDIQEKELLRGLERTARQVAGGIESHLERAETILRVFTDARDPASMDGYTLNTTLYRLLAQQRRHLCELTFMDGGGMERARVCTFRIFQPSEFRDRSGSSEFREPYAGRTFVGPIHISKHANVPVTTVAVPVGQSPRSGPKGVLLAEVTLMEMWNIVSEIDTGRSGYVYVVDRTGRMVASKDLTRMYALFGADMTHIPEVKRFTSGIAWDPGQNHRYRGVGGEDVIGGYAIVDKAGWGVVVELPVREAYAAIRNMVLSIAVVLCVSMLLAGILNRLIIKRVTGGLDRLRRGAELIGEGNLDHRIEVGQEDELGILAQVFNSMTSQLRGMVEDLRRRVAERERAEASLRDSERKYRNLVEATSDWVWICDIKGRNTFSNEAVQELLGYKPREIFGMHTLALMHPDDHERVWKWFRAAVEEKRGWRNSTMRWMHKDGSVRFFDSTAQPLLNTRGELVGFTGTDRDVTERKRAQDVLKESEERFRLLSELSPFGISIIEPDGDYIYLNKKFVELFGYTLDDVPTGRDWFRKAFPDPVYRRDVVAAWVSDLSGPERYQVRSREYVVTCRDGSLRDVLFSAIVMHNDRTYVIYEDLTERRRIEKELVKMQKLESVGILAGGIAHDFNNLLTGILGSISLARMNVDEGSDVYRRLEEAEKASWRARDLTRQLLTFSKGGAPVRKKTALHGVILESCEFILRGSNSRCKYDIPEDLHPVDIDEGQISQAIGNIALNAAQAMPEGGVIEVTARNCVLDEDCGIPLEPGRYVRISIKDEGPGIGQGILPKIFDPYFTTREKGSGLGLATVYSIVKKHDGHVTAESAPGSGAVFHVYLPALPEGELPDGVDVKAEAHAGKGRVLLMDDEEIILQVAGAMLTHLGYDVECARDGRTAIDMYVGARDSSSPFDLVLMDLTIPGGMGGKETIDRLREIDPDVRSIVSSGYSNDPIMADHAVHGFRGVVSKPYRIEELSEVIHRVMHGGDKVRETRNEPVRFA